MSRYRVFEYVPKTVIVQQRKERKEKEGVLRLLNPKNLFAKKYENVTKTELVVSRIKIFVISTTIHVGALKMFSLIIFYARLYKKNMSITQMIIRIPITNPFFKIILQFGLYLPVMISASSMKTKFKKLVIHRGRGRVER